MTYEVDRARATTDDEALTAPTGQQRNPEAVHEPDDSIKPESPTDLDKRSWKYVLRKTVREFSEDQCTDQAAALTYYSVLGIFPAALALTSILGLVDRADQAVETVLDVLRPLVNRSTLDAVEPVLRGMADSDAAGLTLVLGLLGALWSASGYVGAFGRAMNRIYEIDEGRPFWKLRPWLVVITLVAVLMAAMVLVILVVSGPVAESIGRAIPGLDSAVVDLWNVLKWPVLAVLVVMIVALLYYATPNVRQPRFRWISVGASVAIVMWVLVSVGFAFYVANFSSYDRTYGSIAGVIVALLWVWLTNLSLLFGAEIDSELERGRELQAGIPAEVELQLPVRDSTKIEKAQRQELQDIARGRMIREQADPDGLVASQYVEHPTAQPTDQPTSSDTLTTREKTP